VGLLAISLRQPIADLLVAGEMDAVEGHATSKLSGWVGIHAGRGTDETGWFTELWMRAPEQGARAAEASTRLASCGHPPGARKEGCELCARFGALLGVVEVLEARPGGSCAGCSPWVDPGNAHWLVGAAVQWPPQRVQGEPRPFTVDPPPGWEPEATS
jgi:hypothetical protein